MADDLTPRQQEILDFIRNSMEVFSMPPTRAEIAGAFGGGWDAPRSPDDRGKLSYKPQGRGSASANTGVYRGGSFMYCTKKQSQERAHGR